MTRDEINKLRMGDRVMLRGGVGKRNKDIICEVTGETLRKRRSSLSNAYYYEGLDLRDGNLSQLHDNMIVFGDLFLNGTQIEELPKGLHVEGVLRLDHTPITKLPDDLYVSESLCLSYSKIEALPKNLHIGGGLYLSETPIVQLPEGLTVGGDLELKGTRITELPDNMTICGHLDLSNTKIEELPKGLCVGEDLYLLDTLIESLPNDFRIGNQVISNKHAIRNLIFHGIGYIRQSFIDKYRLRQGEYVERRYLYANRILNLIDDVVPVDGYTIYSIKFKNHHVVSDGIHYIFCNNVKYGISRIREYRFRSLENI